jgi:hypothetical protein
VVPDVSERRRDPPVLVVLARARRYDRRPIARRLARFWRSSLLTTSPDFGPFGSSSQSCHCLCGLCRLCAAHFVGPFLKEWAVLLQVVGISALSRFGGTATRSLSGALDYRAKRLCRSGRRGRDYRPTRRNSIPPTPTGRVEYVTMLHEPRSARYFERFGG